MGSDPFEEFEFKPLTEGLGFHQKNGSATNRPQAATEPASSIKPSLSRQLDFIGDDEVNPFKTPLPRRPTTEAKTTQTPVPTPSPVDEILQTLQKSRRLEIENDKKQIQELKNPRTKENWIPTSVSMWAGVLDALLVTASALLCMIIVLVVTKVDLLANLANPDTEGLVYLATFCLFAGVSFVYMVINRVFMGMTPGEWAYDLRLGKPQDQGSFIFALQILTRQILVTATGFVLLPLLSLLVGKDLAGTVTGLRLHRKVG